jgi:hypothetical protein
VLRDKDGKTLAEGDLTQTVKEDRVVSNLIFHFKDGSLDDETAVFSQGRNFRLISDHQVENGPSFPHPLDLSIDASSGMVTVRSTVNGKAKVETHHMDLPPDLANGILLTIIKNLPLGTALTTVSFLVATPKPRLIKLAISPNGVDRFSAVGTKYQATRYTIKFEFGVLAELFARLTGQQPEDAHFWIVGGEAPALVRMQGQLYQGGPVWTIEMTSPVLQ